MNPPVIYQHALACLLGLEGHGLWAPTYDELPEPTARDPRGRSRAGSSRASR